MERNTRLGALAAVCAGACFGVTVPLVQRFGARVGPWSTAALLYVGAAIAAGFTRERSQVTRHAGRIFIIALLGAAIAPAVLAMGLKRIDGASASLLLGFEAMFTVGFSRALYGEPITRRLAVAVLLMLAGGVALVRPTLATPLGTSGVLLVLLAVVCWAADSAIMRPLAEMPRAPVVRAKSLVGIALSLAMALAMREGTPPLAPALALVACGGLGYGVSLRLYLMAQHHVGAARTASVFSAAPFFGAVVAVALGLRGDLVSLAVAGTLIATGILVQASEPYDHRIE
jgi:drug/metabolite transporter (DMT)-like permease